MSTTNQNRPDNTTLMFETLLIVQAGGSIGLSALPSKGVREAVDRGYAGVSAPPDPVVTLTERGLQLLQNYKERGTENSAALVNAAIGQLRPTDPRKMFSILAEELGRRIRDTQVDVMRFEKWGDKRGQVKSEIALIELQRLASIAGRILCCMDWFGADESMGDYLRDWAKVQTLIGPHLIDERRKRFAALRAAESTKAGDDRSKRYAELTDERESKSL